MEFLSKYELRERITSGPIEVFLSQELRTGLSRLVHVLEWTENSPDVTSPEILKLIRRWAPEPPGIILEVGRDPKISYAYLVTTLPVDPLAVQAWVQSYERLAKGVRGNSFAKALQALKEEEGTSPGSSAVQKRASPESEEVTAALDISSLNPSGPAVTKSGATKSGAEPGEFTRAFGEMASPQPKPSSGQFPGADAAAPQKRAFADPQPLPDLGQNSESWTRRETGAFTKEFLGVLGDGPAEADSLPSQPSSSGAKVDTRPPGTFTREFFAVPEKPAAPQPKSSEPSFPSGFGTSTPRTERANILSDIDIPAAKPEYSPLERNSYRGKKSEAEGGSPLRSQMELQEESRNQSQKKKSGEFTNFFGGPGTQSPSEPTDRLPLPEKSRLPAPDRGFRDEPSRPGKDIFDDEFFASSPKPASSTFTENLKAPEPLAAPKADRGGTRSPVPKFDSQVDLGGSGRSQNYTAPAPVPFGGSRSPKLDPASAANPEPVWDRPAEPAGATKVFASPREAPMPGAAPVDDGPSEFTIILSGNQLAPPPPAPAKQASGSGAGQFKLPSMQAPQMPAAPQIPHAPPMPHASMPHAQMPQAPPIPPMAAPKLPAAAPSAPKSPVSYLPLIIVMNVVLLLAIALVLYFALKPH
jgi:hypothetical protein